MSPVTLDLRRCAYCGRIPRGKLREEESRRHAPYCSFDCKEWSRVRPRPDQRVKR
jgi:hypothetical protein